MVASSSLMRFLLPVTQYYGVKKCRKKHYNAKYNNKHQFRFRLQITEKIKQIGEAQLSYTLLNITLIILIVQVYDKFLYFY